MIFKFLNLNLIKSDDYLCYWPLRALRLVLLLWLLVLSTTTNIAFAEGHIATLGNVLGKVFILRKDQKLEGKKGLEVFASDRLETQNKSAVKIQFIDGGSVVAFEGTTLSIQEYKVQKDVSDPSGSTVKSTMEMAKGKIRFFIKPNAAGKNDVKFKTASAVMGIRGTSGAISIENGKTTAGLYTGKAEFANPSGAKSFIVANQQVTVSATDKIIRPEPLSNSLKSMDAQSKQVDPSVANEGGPGSKKEDKKTENKEDKKDERKTEGDSKKQEQKASDEEDPKAKKSGTDSPKKESNSEVKEDSKSNSDKPNSERPNSEKSGPQTNDSSSNSEKSEKGNKGNPPVGANSSQESTTETKPVPKSTNSRASAPDAIGQDSVVSGASKRDPTPEAPQDIKIEKKTVYGVDGKQSLIIKNDDLNNTLKNQIKNTEAPKILPSAIQVESSKVPDTSKVLESIKEVSSTIQQQVNQIELSNQNVKKTIQQVNSPAVVPTIAPPTKKSVEIIINMPKPPQ